MPKAKSVANKSQTKKVTIKELTCIMCGKTQNPSFHYQSFNPLHQTGKLPYCKKCIQGMSINKDGSLNIEGFKQALKMVDRPFLYEIVKSSSEDNMETVGCYFKNLGMPQYRSLGWKDSVFEPEINENEIKTTIKYNTDITDEIIELFGAGYSPDEYQAMWRKYNFLKNNYKTKTNMHIEALVSYVRFKVKEEFAIANGQVDEAKKWASLSKDAATAAKINPQQLSAADLSEGLSTVSQISKAVEQVVDIISILPKFKQEPQDIVDFTIWSYVNYERDLNGKPLCSYEDVYKFYDKMVSDNMLRYSFLKKDATKQGRNNAKEFIESNEELEEENSLEEGEEIAEELSN